MNAASRRNEVLTTLKLVNNAIVAMRLYPPNSPQILQNSERCYKKLKSFLHQHRALVLTRKENTIELANEPLSDEELKYLGNFVIPKQMELLELQHMVITSRLDRASHQKVLELFCAKSFEIKKAGGGKYLAEHLGIMHFFPEQLKTDRPEDEKVNNISVKSTQDTIIPDEYYQILLKGSSNSAMISRVGQLMFSAHNGGQLLAFSITRILKNFLQKKSFGPIPSLPQLFTSAISFIPTDTQKQTAQHTAELLLDQLTTSLRTLLFCQHFNNILGSAIEKELYRQISSAQFFEIFKELQRRQDILRLTPTEHSQELAFISNALQELQKTRKGQQLLSQKKTKEQLETGEKTRRTKRMQAGLASLSQGNLTVLQSDEFCDYLPYFLQKISEDGRKKEVTIILEILIQGLQKQPQETNNRIAKCLVTTATQAFAKGSFDITERLIDPLLQWFHQEKKTSKVWEQCCVLLHRFMLNSFKQGQLEKADIILEEIYKVSTKHTGKTKQKIIHKCQKQIIDRPFLEQLLTAYFLAPDDESTKRRIIYQGAVGPRFLIEKFLSADNSDKEKIVALLLFTTNNLEIATILEEKLQEPMPLSDKQTLLELLGNHGNSSHIAIVIPFLNNDDIHMQRVALDCFYAFGGKKQKKLLVAALNDVREGFKPEIVRILATFGDKDVVEAFAEILQDQANYSNDFRDILLSEICKGLGKCRIKEAENVLESFLKVRNTRSGNRIGQEVWNHCEEALSTLAQNYREELRHQARMSKLQKSTITRFVAAKKVQETPQEVTIT